MRESLGVSLPSRPLLLKLGLLSLPWALCAGLHAVGLGVWLVLRSVGSPAWPCSSSSCAPLGKR